MFRTIACLSTLAALALTSVAPAHAFIFANGLSDNGMSLNGIGPNGTFLNGFGYNGTSLKSGVFAIDGIELPAAR